VLRGVCETRKEIRGVAEKAEVLIDLNMVLSTEQLWRELPRQFRSEPTDEQSRSRHLH